MTTEASFVSESIIPAKGSRDTGAMARGEPGLPTEFTWRSQPLKVRKLLRAWKETGSCRHGSGEAYVRKHWFEVETTDNQIAKIYFERQARGRNVSQRWWLYNLATMR